MFFSGKYTLEGDEESKLIHDAMGYQVAKDIGAAAAVLNGGNKNKYFSYFIFCNINLVIFYWCFSMLLIIINCDVTIIYVESITKHIYI